MTASPELAADVALFLLETMIQSLLFCLAAMVAMRALGIQHPGARTGFWLMVHRPTDTSRRAARLLQGEAVQPCPALHRRVGWIMVALALLLGGLI